MEPFWLFHVDLLFEFSIEVGIPNIKTREVPTLKRSQSKDEAHSLESHNGGEDLVKVFSFDLREALCYEAGSLSSIGFDIKDPSVFMTLQPLGRTTMSKTWCLVRVSISRWQAAHHSSSWPAGSPIMSL